LPLSILFVFLSSVSASNNALYYGDVFGKIVALQVGTFETAAPVLPPTLSPMGAPTLAPSMELSSATPTSDEVVVVSSAAPTSDEVVVVPPPSVPGEVDTAQTQTPSGGESNDTVMIAVYSVAAIVGFAATAILAFVFISYSRNRRQKNNSTLPFAMGENPHGPNDPSANTAIPAELQSEPAPYTRRSPRRKKKPTGSRSSTPERSPSRLAAIAESPDDFFEQDDGEGGFEVLHNVEGEERDIENHIFGYKGTTPDTSFTTSSASRDYYSYLDEDKSDKSVSSRESDGSDYENKHGGALVPIVSDVPRPYYMMETRPGAAGSIVRVSDGQHQNLNNDIPLICLARSKGTTTPVSYTEDDRQVTENGAMVPVIHQQERAVYAKQITSNKDFPPINQMPSDGTTSPVYIEDDKPGARHEAMVPMIHGQERSAYAMNMPPDNGIPPISQARSDGTTSPIYIEDDERGAGRGAMNSVDRGNERPRSSRSEATSSPVYMEDDIQPAGYGAAVPVNDGNQRSAYAVKAPPIFMPLVPLSHRTQSDATNTSVQIKEGKQIGVPGATVPVNCDQVRLANDVESLARNHAILMEKIQRARSEGTSSPNSLYTTETKEYMYKLQSVRSEGTLSPTSIYTSETKETVKSAKAPESPERVRSVYALKSPSTNRSLLFELADAPTRATELPRYEFKDQLAPGISAYIDDDGSVEMVSDDETAPLDEIAARRPLPQWSVAPASVKLDACNSPPTQPESPRKDRFLPSIGSDRGGFSKRSPPSPLVSTESNLKVNEEAKRTSTKTEVSRPVSQYRLDADSSRLESPRKDRSLPLMGSDRGGFSKILPQRSSIQKAVEKSNHTSTKAEASRLEAHPRVDTAIPPRLMRKMRLSRIVQEWTTEDPSVQEWKAKRPSASEHDSSEYDSSDSSEQHVIPKKMEPTNNVTPSPPESILLTCSESESTEEDGGNEASRIPEKSQSAPETLSSRPLNTMAQTSRGQDKSRNSPETSSSRPRNTQTQTRRGRENIVLTCSESESTEEEGGTEASRIPEKSRSAPETLPSRPLNKMAQTRRGQEKSRNARETSSSRPRNTQTQTHRGREKSRNAPETSSSRPLNNKAQTSRGREKSQKAPVYSSSHPSFTEAQEEETTLSESLVSSVFTGLFSKVEEVDRMFFNPTPLQTATTKKKTTKRDAPFRDITVVRSDDESLPPPPRSPRESARFLT
jgi:hypothetical protein